MLPCVFHENVPAAAREIMHVTLIHNPGAGDDARHDADELRTLVRAAGHEVAYHSSKKKGWKKALADARELVAVAGGDGTVGKVAKRLAGRGVPLAVLPLGTANNIARTLGLTGHTAEQLIAGWARARRVPFDIGVADGPWGECRFIESVGAGLFASLMAKLDARDNLALAHVADPEERLRHVVRLLRERVRDWPAKPLRVELDGADLSGAYFLLEVLNIRHVGPNLMLAPAADPGDARLDVLLLADGDRAALDAYLAGCLSGRDAVPVLPVRRVRRVRFEWTGFGLHLDDEAWPGAADSFPLTPAEIDLRLDPHALELLVPAD
ncbi:MAG TPA: diacylglycerol kinase family protein [Pyrinomonadaceae bacterium]|jgi:diacylglycerol kinase family enzyme